MFSDSEKYKNEQFLVTMIDIINNKVFQTLIPHREAMSELLANLSKEKYIIIDIKLLNLVKGYDDLIVQLRKEKREENKPDGLNFGI